MGRHVVVDHANVAAGLAAAGMDRGRAIDLPALLGILAEGGEGMRAFGAVEGSEPEATFDAVQELGWDTYLVEPGPMAAGILASLLRGVAVHAVLDATDEDRQVLTLVTDDVGDDGYGTSFATQARRALSWGWEVEVWSWRREAIAEYLDLAAGGARIVQRCLADHAGAILVAGPATTGAGGRAEAPRGDPAPGPRRAAPTMADMGTPGAEQPWI